MLNISKLFEYLPSQISWCPAYQDFFRLFILPRNEGIIPRDSETGGRPVYVACTIKFWCILKYLVMVNGELNTNSDMLFDTGILNFVFF